MSKTIPVQSLDALQRVLLARRDAQCPPAPWRVLAADYPGVPAGTLCAIAKGREPHKASVRAALGLPVLVPVAACACGQVHVKRGRCPNAPRPADLAKFTAAIDWLAGRECLTPPAVRVYGRRGKAVTW